MASIVNGYKVIKRYSFGGFIAAIILIALICLPVLNIFIPIFNFGDPLGKFGTAGSTYGITIIDLIMGVLLNFGIALPGASPNAMMIKNLLSGGSIPSQNFVLLFLIASIVYIVLIVVFVIVGIIMLIRALILIIGGKTNNYHAPLSLTIGFSILGLCYGGGSIALNLFYTNEYNILIGAGGTQLQPYIKKPIVITAAFAVLLIIQIITYCIAFKNRIYIGDVPPNGSSLPAQQPQPIVVNINNPNSGSFQTPVVTCETPKSNAPQIILQENKEPNLKNAVANEKLPESITSIPGHAYAQNQALKYAVIPEGIENIGAGAFANCLHLQMVTIPKTVNHIGYNAFFNCVNLVKINYAGTKEEWAKIIRGSNWLTKVPNNVIECSNGKIIVDPIR